MMSENDLNRLRQQIDQVDQELLKLFNQRCKLVQSVGQWKRERNLPIYVPEREAALLKHLTDTNPGPLPNQALLAVYREIISAARTLEEPICVAILGPSGTHSERAAKKHFGSSTNYFLCKTLREVFEAVETGRAHYGCVPVENSFEGSVGDTLDALRTTPLYITGEIIYSVRHNLYTACPLNELRKIYSHPQALAQCRSFLQQNAPNAELIPVSSTTMGIQQASQDPTGGAVAGTCPDASLPLAAENIGDRADNRTRFLILGRQQCASSGNDKTSIVLVLPHHPGALVDVLLPFQNAKINLNMIESRPARMGSWEYAFFIDIDGHQDIPEVAQACELAANRSASFKLLGSYPKGENPL